MTTATKQDLETYILFEVAGTTYGVKSREVLHMEMIEQITPVPNAPSFMDGVVFSRGQVVALVNLRARFGFQREAVSLRTRLLVVQAGGRAIGLVVDTAREFRPISKELIQPPDATMGGTTEKYLSGIATLDNRLVLILDLQAVLNPLETAALAAEAAMAS